MKKTRKTSANKKAVWKATKPTWGERLSSMLQAVLAGSWKLRWKIWRKSQRRAEAP